jgi:mannose-6-phosphate isomerase-like protein (cupin superfamily)
VFDADIFRPTIFDRDVLTLDISCLFQSLAKYAQTTKLMSATDAAAAFPYAVHLDIKFDALDLIDVPSLVEACTDQWYNQTLCKVNDSVVRLGVMQDEYHWHKHDNDDEFFFVLGGTFIIDLEGRSVALSPQQGFVVPKGVIHRTRAPENNCHRWNRTTARAYNFRQAARAYRRGDRIAAFLLQRTSLLVAQMAKCRDVRYESVIEG